MMTSPVWKTQIATFLAVFGAATSLADAQSNEAGSAATLPQATSKTPNTLELAILLPEGATVRLADGTITRASMTRDASGGELWAAHIRIPYEIIQLSKHKHCALAIEKGVSIQAGDQTEPMWLIGLLVVENKNLIIDLRQPFFRGDLGATYDRKSRDIDYLWTLFRLEYAHIMRLEGAIYPNIDTAIERIIGHIASKECREMCQILANDVSSMPTIGTTEFARSIRDERVRVFRLVWSYLEAKRKGNLALKAIIKGAREGGLLAPFSAVTSLDEYRDEVLKSLDEMEHRVNDLIDRLSEEHKDSLEAFKTILRTTNTILRSHLKYM